MEWAFAVVIICLIVTTAFCYLVATGKLKLGSRIKSIKITLKSAVFEFWEYEAPREVTPKKRPATTKAPQIFKAKGKSLSVAKD